MLTIKINLDKKCEHCKQGGALENGLCMSCITKALKRGEYDHILKKIRDEIKEEINK